jgi:hypothetical protein
LEVLHEELTYATVTKDGSEQGIELVKKQLSNIEDLYQALNGNRKARGNLTQFLEERFTCKFYKNMENYRGL